MAVYIVYTARWKKLKEKDCCEWKLMIDDPQERSTWRSGVRSALRAASQLPERGSLMWMMPLHFMWISKRNYYKCSMYLKHLW